MNLQECAALRANKPIIDALHMSPSIIDHLVGSTKFQQVVSRQPPVHSEMEEIMKTCLAQMYPGDYIIMMEVKDKKYL